MADVIDTLELRVQSDAEKAIQALSNMQKMLQGIKSTLSGIKTDNLSQFANIESGIQEATRSVGEFKRSASKITIKPTIDKTQIENTVKQLRERFKDVGKDFVFKGNATDLQNAISSLEKDLDKLYEREKKSINLGRVDTASFEALQYDIANSKNKLVAMKKQLEEIYDLARQHITVQLYTEKQKRSLEDYIKYLREYKSIVASGGVDTGVGMSMPTAEIQHSLEALIEDFPEAIDLIQEFKDLLSDIGNINPIKAMTYDSAEISAQIDEMGQSAREANEALKETATNTEEVSSELEKVRGSSQLVSVLDSIKYGFKSMGDAIRSIPGNTLEAVRGYVKNFAIELWQLVKLPFEGIYNIGKGIASIGKSIVNIPITALHAINTGIRSLASAIVNLPSRALDAVKNGLLKISFAAKSAAQNIAGRLVSGVKKLASSMLGFNKSTKQTNGSLGASLKTLLKYGLGIRSLFVLFNKLRSAAKEGFTNLAQYSPEVNSSITSVTSALLTFKNALAAAFAPILTVVAPYITYFINLMTAAANAIGRFFAALTGKNFAAQAVAVTKDFADSVSGVGGSAKKANKELNKFIASWHEVNNMSSNDDSDGGGGGGGGGGGADLSAQDMFTDVEIESRIKDFVNRLKESWENADFTWLGRLVGEKLNSALEMIPWDKIKETSRKVGKSFATLLNGFLETPELFENIGKTWAHGINTAFEFLEAFASNFHFDSLGTAISHAINGALETLDWPLIQKTMGDIGTGIAETLNGVIREGNWELAGSSLGEAINTVIDTAYGFVETFSWREFGQGIADYLNGAVETADFKKAGTTLSDGTKGILDTINTALEEFDWEQLGEDVKLFIESIDWNGISDRFFELLGAVFGGIGAFLRGLLGDEIKGIGDYFMQHIYDELGGADEDTTIIDIGIAIIKGIYKGIQDAILGIGTWIKEHILEPFVEGFKKAFDINSPAKVMQPLGGYIFLGIIEGFKNRFGEWTKTLNEWYTKHIAPWFTTQKWAELFSTIGSQLKIAWDNAVQEWSKRITNWWNSNVQPWFTVAKWTELFTSIKTSLKSVWDSTVGQWVSMATNWWDINVQPWFTVDKWLSMASGIKEGLLQAFDDAIRAVKEAWGGFTGWIGEKVSSVFGGISLFGNTKDDGFRMPISTYSVAPGIQPMSISSNVAMPIAGTGGLISDAATQLYSKISAYDANWSIPVLSTGPSAYSAITSMRATQMGADAQMAELLFELRQLREAVDNEAAILERIESQGIVLDDNTFAKKYQSAATSYRRRTNQQLGVAF